jgi:hypothetical protein
LHGHSISESLPYTGDTTLTNPDELQ